MAHFKNFAKLVEDRKDELGDLESEEYLRVGNHAYVLNREVNITDLLRDLSAHGTESAAAPVQHLHIYCHRLSGTLEEGGELKLRLQNDEGGCVLSSLHIFTAEVLAFTGIRLDCKNDQQAPFQLCLYFDVESGPENFWVNRYKSSVGLAHVLRSAEGCLDLGSAPCTASNEHFDLSATGAAGLRISVSWGIVDIIAPIPYVYSDELRMVRPSEFATFGPDARRLFNLPRLLDGLFASAGGELMGQKPNVSRIIAKLRFIKRCAQASPGFSGLVQETDILLDRLALPRSFPTRRAGPDDTIDDCFFVPEKLPKALAERMEATITNLIDANRSLENKEYFQKLQMQISETGGAIIESVRAIVGTTVTQVRLDNMAEDAASSTITASHKMDDLRKYERELNDASEVFEAGIKNYQEKMTSKMWKALAMGLGEVVFSVGIAIYTGGVGAPLTVGAVNKLLQGAEAIKESSRLWIAIKALGTTSLKVYPKLAAAIGNHRSFSPTGSVAKQKDAVDDLHKTADNITDSMFSDKSGDRIDFGGLLAGWREMDLCADSAFQVIKEEVAPEKVDGLEAYRVAIKKLVIRGETLVTALREAYVARTEYLLLRAEMKARNAALGEIQSLHDGVLSTKTGKDIAFMSVKHHLNAELAQRRRVVFNMLHKGVLALLYQTNDIKTQREQRVKFEKLSPARTADELADHWADFTNETGNVKQPQSDQISVNASEAFPLGWHDLLLNDRETSFQIPSTLPKLNDLHHMRIRTLYVEFVGLKRHDGTTTGLDDLQYTIWLGPLMLDRASPRNNAKSSEAVTVQYYMDRRALYKKGSKNELLDDGDSFARRTLCCSGKVSFKKRVVDEGWNLASITDIILHITCQTLNFDEE